MTLFSICIPTYNRAIYLKQTLDSIISDELFLETDLFEIVISDNHSSDNTKNLCEEYKFEYGNKIKYKRQNENLLDRNFIEVLRLASGKYAKLHNDNRKFIPGSLKYIANIIQCGRNEDIIFFGNGSLSIQEEELFCADFNTFMMSVTYYSTWIGGFCIHKEQFDLLKDPGRLADTKLLQVDWLCLIMAHGGKAQILNRYLLEEIPLLTVINTDYSVSKVFGKYYLSILKPYTRNGMLNKSTYQHIKKEVFLKHIFPRTFKKIHAYQRGGYLINLEDYWSNWYFYYSFKTAFIWIVKSKIEKNCPKWLINLFCIFVPNRKKRIHIQNKYIKP